MKKISLSLLLAIFFICSALGQRIKASYSPEAFYGPFTGYVIAYLSKDNNSPKDASIGFESLACYNIYVKNIMPGETITFDDNATAYPVPLSDLERGTYFLQVVWDRNQGGRSIAHSAGNIFNPAERVQINKDREAVIHLASTKTIQTPAFKETTFTKTLKAPSALLSKFHDKPMTVDAAVILPKEYYTEPQRKFPVLFVIAGYGGDYHRYSGDTAANVPMGNTPAIRVFLDGNCSLGHSTYANSSNNGPWGDALITEFIPLLEKTYRCNGARLLSGHSSGGWTVLWLQTQYPETFIGCWSSSPDPVDFRNFQQIDLYTEKNMFYGKDSMQRMVGTVAGFIPWASMKKIYGMENVVYRGEQMHSFDAVFGPRGTDGKPQTICNSITGEINPDVVAHWKKYDISAYLRNNWEKIKPGLEGKLRITVGTSDNFLLNHSVTLLESEMKKLHSATQFTYYPGDHFTVSTPQYRKDGIAFLEQKYKDWLAASQSSGKQGQ